MSELYALPAEDAILREPPPLTWRRRAVSVPGLIAASHTAVAATPMAIGAALVRDLLRRDARCPTARAWLALVGNLVIHEIGVARLGLRGWRRRGETDDKITARAQASYDVECELAQQLVNMIQWLYSVKIIVEGETALGPDPNIVLARHCSLLDPVLLMAIAAPRGVRIRYVSKRELLWDPCIDILGHRYPVAFVQRRGKAREADLGQVAQLADHLRLNEAVLVFPEGTRFSEEKKARALKKIEASHPEFAARARTWPHLLPPHIAGVLKLLERDKVDEVVMCAHVGLEGISHAKDLIDGALIGRTLRFRFWRIHRRDIPSDKDGRIRWLYDTFDEMNGIVEDMLAQSSVSRP